MHDRLVEPFEPFDKDLIAPPPSPSPAPALLNPSLRWKDFVTIGDWGTGKGGAC